MLKNGTVKVFLVLFALVVVLAVFTSDAAAINIMQNASNTVINQTTDPNAIPSINGVTNSVNTVNTVNAVVNQVAPNVVNTTGNLTQNKVSTYTNTDLPKTGVEDYPIIILMAACVIVAIYAYIKVRNYNNF